MDSQSKDRRKTTPAIMCLKIILHIFNLVYLIIGAAILGIGIWTKLELHVYMELAGVYYDESSYVMIGIGALILIVALGGFYCTAKDKIALLYMYAIFIGFIAILELAAGIAAGVLWKKIDALFSNGLQDSVHKSNKTANLKNAWDKVQQTLKCCGADGPKDWPHGAPDSCFPGGHGNATADAPYPDGCHKKVTADIKIYLYAIVGSAFGFLFIQFVGVVFACCLAKKTSKNNYEQIY